jgi:hypothetical protein
MSKKIIPKKKITTAEKRILKDIEESVEFIKDFKKGLAKAKPMSQLLSEL